MLILSLEASTTSAKALLFNSEEGVVEYISEPYPNKISDGKIQDTEGIYLFLMKVASKISNNKSIDAITVCGAWHSLVVCNQSMVPLTKTFTWAYTGASKAATEIRTDKLLSSELYQRTGCVVHSIYPAYKLLHLKNNGLNLKDKCICGQGSYIFFRITGERVDTASMASGSALLNIHSLGYDEMVLKLVGIAPMQLGQLHNHMETLKLNACASRLLGVAEGIPVLPPLPDGALNQIGAKAIEKGIMTLSVGTSAALRLSTELPSLSKGENTWCYRSPTTWLTGAATNGGCNCLDWIKSSFFDSTASYADIENHLPENDEGPVFLPFLFGERCPGWKEDRLGGFFEIKDKDTPYHFYKSVLEGVIMNIFQCYNILISNNDQGVPSQIMVSGGIIRSKVWTQMLADTLQMEISCSNMEQTSLLGGAMIAMSMIGKDNKNNFSEEKFTVKPRQKMADYYNARFEKYRYWYDKTS